MVKSSKWKKVIKMHAWKSSVQKGEERKERNSFVTIGWAEFWNAISQIQRANFVAQPQEVVWENKSLTQLENAYKRPIVS